MSLTTVQGLLPDFRATLKIHKKSNFDQNHLKISTQHKYMYIRAAYRNSCYGGKLQLYEQVGFFVAAI